MRFVMFASTSGSCASVAYLLADALGPPWTTINLKEVSNLDFLPDPEWVIVGSPTYGKGDWHYLWELRKEESARLLKRTKKVAAFGIGDARKHPKTFCGSLGKIHDLCGAHSVKLIGQTALSAECENSPAIRDGTMPGLALDYKKDARRIKPALTEWLLALRLPNYGVRVDP